jgi:hypothetical protein
MGERRHRTTYYKGVRNKFHAHVVFLRGKANRFLVHWRFAEPHSRSPCDAEQNFFNLPAMEPLSSSPYPDPMVTKLCRIHICIIAMNEKYITDY